MKEHKFIPIEGTSPKVYVVECLLTGGSFSTEVWRKGHVPKDKCPCCEKYLK